MDVYYSIRDVTSLRWITNIKNSLDKHKKVLRLGFYELNSEKAKNNFIKAESIIVNKKLINQYQLLKILKIVEPGI